MERFNRLRSKPAVAGWISIAVFIWKILGEIDTFKSVVQNMNAVWSFLSTTIGMLILLFAGLALLLFAVFKPEKKPSVTIAKHPIETAESTPSWLEKTLDEDRANLEKRLIVQPWLPQWIFKGLRQTDAYIEVIIKVVNTAIFPLLVTGATGSFVVDGSQCHWEATIEGSTRIEHGEMSSVRIKQRITKEVAQLLIGHKDDGKTVDINLGQCRLVLQPQAPNKSNELVKLFIGGQNTVEIPRNL